jgi:hypothetical protein
VSLPPSQNPASLPSSHHAVCVQTAHVPHLGFCLAGTDIMLGKNQHPVEGTVASSLDLLSGSSQLQLRRGSSVLSIDKSCILVLRHHTICFGSNLHKTR